MTTKHRKYPARIPRDRAVAGLDLANAILDYDDDLEPNDPAAEVEVSAATWDRLLAFARKAAAELPSVK